MLEPISIAEHRATGAWWKRTLIGPHLPPQRRGDMFVDHPLPPPELWHFEDVCWLERSRLGRTMQRVAAGGDPHQLISDAAPELEPAIVEQFWNELVPWIGARHRGDWRGLRQSVSELRTRYGRERLYLFERIAGRYGALLFARLEPLFNDAGIRPYWGEVKPTLDVPSLYELRLLTHHIIAEGKVAYDAVIENPAAANAHAARMNMFTGHGFQALFHYEALVYQAQKLRLLDAVTKTLGRHEPAAKQRAARERSAAFGKRCFGAITAIEFLKTQFTGDEDVLDIPEQWPRFAFTPQAELVCVQSAAQCGAKPAGETPH
jgi:hypothetical protein